MNNHDQHPYEMKKQGKKLNNLELLGSIAIDSVEQDHDQAERRPVSLIEQHHMSAEHRLEIAEQKRDEALQKAQQSAEKVKQAKQEFQKDNQEYIEAYVEYRLAHQECMQARQMRAVEIGQQKQATQTTVQGVNSLITGMAKELTRPK